MDVVNAARLCISEYTAPSRRRKARSAHGPAFLHGVRSAGGKGGRPDWAARDGRRTGTRVSTAGTSITLAARLSMFRQIQRVSMSSVRATRTEGASSRGRGDASRRHAVWPPSSPCALLSWMAAASPLERHTIGVLLVDDDAIVRAWIADALRNSEFFVATAVEDAAAAPAAAADGEVSVLLVEYRLPDEDGVELVRRLRERGVDAPALLLTARAHAGLNESALAAGCQGALVKTGHVEPLLTALRLVVSDEPAFDYRNPAGDFECDALAARQREVLGLVTRGLTTDEIAERAEVEPDEVRATVADALAKLRGDGRSDKAASPAAGDAVPAETPASPRAEPLRGAARELASASAACARHPSLSVRERAEVYAAFRESAVERLRALKEEVATLETADQPAGVPGDRLALHAHVVRSGAITVGAPDIEALAGGIEAAVRDTPRLDMHQLRHVDVLVRELGVGVGRLQSIDVGPRYVSPRREDPSGPPIKSVLAIDDDPAQLKLLEVLLRREPNIRFDRAASGAEGLGEARRSPDLILLEVRLPDADGVEVLRRLRGRTWTREVPVIVASLEVGGRADEVRAAGADVVLEKPIDAGQFLRLVRIGVGRG
jgi:DNA-binding NarL/FixJ family response regulator